MSLLRIDSSVLGPYSSSRALADTVVDNWKAEHAGETVVTRDLAAKPVLATDWIAAVSGNQTPADQRTPEQAAALALADELFTELKSAETIVVATGLYNWGVNQLLKAYIDQVIVGGGIEAGEFLKGKDVAIVIARGGYYGEDGPKAGWDHSIDYLVRIFGEVWGANVRIVDRDFTLVGVNPALDAFKEQGAALKEAAQVKAEVVGKELASAYAERKSA
ncbi:FMN-dependent NADH-azoreductase [Nocardioides sp. Kera G14]|uniref:FMN-dependent NADH-azoreductase n=1 Tax=Nocardioides sp. Kera G14 TaxID=2884264 RepID=UPI001D114E58|nr:NAD(P)H-dependent oxidoreductase [Nocardioides sp. Kera G14]UDY23719.1 NAD(P)H-dependent oxidoreductase [Nocardioides sp. Kera G14]